MSGYAACAIAGDLGVRTVGIDQTNFEIGAEVREHPLDAVGADTLMAIADAAGEIRDILRGQGSVDQQEIVAAGAGLDKWNASRRGAHSRSTWPRQVALSRTVEAFNCRSISFCSRLQPSTSNCSRTCLPVSPLTTFCIRRW